MSTHSPAPPAEPAWEELAMRLQRGDRKAMQELYDIFYKGTRYMLFRHLGPDDLDDKVHDVFVAVNESIRKGELRDPSRLPGYIHTIVRRQIVDHIERAANLRRNRVEFEEAICDLHPDPEFEIMERQNIDIALSVLQRISGRDREVLVRFYFNEETVEQICGALSLTATQFRLIKSRAKRRFGELGRRCLATKSNP